jgi:epoxide hydrolase-like protein
MRARQFRARRPRQSRRPGSRLGRRGRGVDARRSRWAPPSSKETCISATSEKPAGAAAVRPFRVEIPQAEVDELHRPIAATRWPDRETVDDGSQGTPLAKLQELVRYWGGEYDWRKFEAKLNGLPQFVTSLVGLDIHFIHVRSPHPGACR